MMLNILINSIHIIMALYITIFMMVIIFLISHIISIYLYQI
jgi:hypothetical protein